MPELAVEAAASLKVWPVTITVAGQEWRIPPTPATGWLLTLIDGGWLDIVPGMLDPDSRTAITDQLIDGQLSYQELVATAQDAVTAAAGRPWWTAATLVVAASRHWPAIGAQLLTTGVDLDHISLSAACDVIYHVCTRRMKKEERSRFDRKLLTPPAAARAAAAPVMSRSQAVDQFRRQLADDARGR